MAFRAEWLTRMGLKPEKCSLIAVMGDSMEPTKASWLVERLVQERLNVIAAAGATCSLGVPIPTALESLREYTPPRHRLEFVARVGDIDCYNDSKATNVGATLAALRGYPDKSVHLILGGQAKGQDFSVLLAEVRRAVDKLYLIGEDGPAIGEALQGTAPTENCHTLDEAVARMRGSVAPGQMVLLAPACASLDQFSDYGERGDRFADLAREEVASCP